MKIPSFRYPGGKARLRKWLIQYFPPLGNRYIEPFAGLGNVFFLAKSELKFQSWWINDIFTCKFFKAICEIDYDDLPELVNRDTFKELKEDRNSPLSILLESRISFGGKGYDFGYSGDCNTHIGYRKKNYILNLMPAKELLNDVKITDFSWEQLPYENFTSQDFLYFDPPYYGTSIGSYENIDHEKLLTILTNKYEFSWVLSGYDSEFYRSFLGSPFARRDRAAEIAATNGKKGERREECIWVSPPLYFLNQ